MAVGSEKYRRLQYNGQKATRKAVKDGLLPSPVGLPCADCGKPAYCYDHRDYTKPLEVDPVCKRCNIKRGPSINADAASPKGKYKRRWVKRDSYGLHGEHDKESMFPCKLHCEVDLDEIEERIENHNLIFDETVYGYYDYFHQQRAGRYMYLKPWFRREYEANFIPA